MRQPGISLSHVTETKFKMGNMLVYVDKPWEAET